MGSGAGDDVDGLLALMDQADSFELIEKLYAEPDVELAAATFAKVAMGCYARKNLSLAVLIGRAGLQFCLSHVSDAAKRPVLRQKAAALAFNLGADTWPGWGDEGIVSTPSDLVAGLDAARLNLRLARELEKGPLAESKAYWLIGAHRLAQGDRDGAIAEFSRAKERARAAQRSDYEEMNAGYIALVGALRGDSEAHSEFSRIVQGLESTPESKDAPAFAEQLVKALEVFRSRNVEDRKTT